MLQVVSTYAPLVPLLGFPLGLVWHVVADLLAKRAGRRAPTRTSGLSSLAQGVLGFCLGVLTARWDVLPTALWWVALWLVLLGGVVLALRWRELRTSGDKPRREGVGALLWGVLAAAAVAETV